MRKGLMKVIGDLKCRYISLKCVCFLCESDISDFQVSFSVKWGELYYFLELCNDWIDEWINDAYYVPGTTLDAG